MTTGFITLAIGKYLPDGITVGKSIGATVAAALGVYVLLMLRKINPGRLFSGGGDGNAK